MQFKLSMQSFALAVRSSVRSFVHSSLSYRTAGVLLVLSGFSLALGQLIGIVRWRGMYSLMENRPSDLSASVCGVLRDSSGVRFVCNPSHSLTAATAVFAGVAVVIAAIVMVATARRDGHRGVYGPSILLGISGAVSVAAAVVAVDVHPLGHDILLLLYLLSMWATMEVLVESATRHAETTGDAHPLIYGAYVPMTRVMEFFSIVGTLTLLFSGRDVMPGAFERASGDLITLWVVVFGLGLFSLGGAADRERMRVVEMVKRHRESTPDASSEAALAGFGRQPKEAQRGEGIVATCAVSVNSVGAVRDSRDSRDSRDDSVSTEGE